MNMSIRKPEIIYSRVDLSHYHLYSAFLFTQNAEVIEATASQMANSDVLYRYRSFVMGAVFSSVAFLEAAVAELRSDANNPAGISVVGLTTGERLALTHRFSQLRRKTELLEQYQAALAALDKPLFQRDRSPYRKVSLLIQLRNYLVHFPAEWLANSCENSGPLAQPDRPLIERQLKGQFPSTKFAWEEQPFFPAHCLSAGCARWAAESTLTFRQDFSVRAGTVTKHFKPALGDM